MTPAEIWWRHARIALPLLLCAMLAAATTNLDVRVAQHLFFDSATRRWLGSDQWWANEFLHEGGRWLIRAIAAIAIAGAIAVSYDKRWHEYRRPACYFIISMALTVGIVGLLKSTTNIDCPWDLNIFDGPFPYVGLFADRSDTLPQAKCFPAAHASTGYALMALYFAMLERSRTSAILGLGIGIALGAVFGFGQQARGAHFVSHDIGSAAIAWTVSLTVYTWGFRARLFNERVGA